MSDDDKFGLCWFIWMISIFLFGSAFTELDFPMWVEVALTLISSFTISIWIYIKWTK